MGPLISHQKLTMKPANEVSCEFTILQSHIFLRIICAKLNHNTQIQSGNMDDSLLSIVYSKHPRFAGFLFNLSHRIHVWYISLHLSWFLWYINVGKYIPYIESFGKSSLPQTVFFTDSPRHYHRHLNDAITSTAHNVRLGHDLGGLFQGQGAVMDIWYLFHRENGGKTRGMVPLIFKPIYTLYIVGIYWDFVAYIPFKRTS